MTKPQEPKRYDLVVNGEHGPVNGYMLAEEALAYAEAVRNEALEWAMQVAIDEREKDFPDVRTIRDIIRMKIDSLKREGK